VIIEPAVSTTPQPRRKLRDGIEPDLRRMNRDLSTYRKVRRNPSIGAAIWTAVVRKSSDSSAGRAGQFRASSKIYVTVAPSLSLDFSSFAMRRSPVRSRSRPPNYFALRKPDAPSGFRRYETGRVGLYSCEFRKAWDSRAVGRRFHSEAQGKRSSPAAVLHPGERDAR